MRLASRNLVPMRASRAMTVNDPRRGARTGAAAAAATGPG